MSEQATDAAGPTPAARLFGSELRAARNRACLSLAGLCDLFRTQGRVVHRGYLTNVENGDRFPTDRLFAEIADRVLATDGLLARLWDFTDTQRAGQHDQAQQTRRLVAKLAADTLAPVISGDIVFVPYIVGTDIVAYMRVSRRSFLATGGLATARLATTATDSISSASARTRVGVTASDVAPIEHLRRLRQLLVDSDNMLGPRRVIPTVHEQIKVIQALRRECTGSDQRQLMELQTQFAEFASWLHQDIGDLSRAGYWLDRALEWSQTVGDAQLTAYVMARKAQVAGEAHDLGHVVDLAMAAQDIARPGSRIAAVGKTYQAFGHALRGETDASAQAFDYARNAVEELTTDHGPWGAWLNVAYVEIHRAQAIDTLGQHSRAADIFATAIRQLPPDYHRDRGVYLAREAVSRAGAGAPEQAANVGMQALCVAEDTGSTRILRELSRLDNALRTLPDLPAVVEFRTSLNSLVRDESATVHDTGRPTE